MGLKLKIIAAEAPEHKRFVNRTLYVYIVDDQYADQKIYDIFTSAGISEFSILLKKADS